MQHVTRSKFTRGGGSHNISLLTPTGRRPVDIRLVKIVYLCIHCLGKLKSHNSGVQCELNSNHYGYIHRDEAEQLTDEERFMKLSDMFPSEYLRGIDIGNPVIVTIKGVAAEQVRNRDNNKVEQEFVMRFSEIDKKLRLNLTMAKECAKLVNDPEMDTDNWTGRRVALYRTTVKAFGQEHIVVRIRKPESSDVDLAKAIKQAQPKAKNGKQGEEAWKNFLTRMAEEFGLDEAGVKAKLKELKYTGFNSEKAEEMYESIKVLMSQQEAAEAGQAELFEEDELSDDLKEALGAYSEDM